MLVPRRRIIGLLFVLATAGLAAAGLWQLGEPPSLDRAAAQRERDGIVSMLGEGSVLARIVARGDGWDHASRVRASELAEALADSATTIESARLAKSNDDAVRLRRAAAAASDASSALETFSTTPGDRTRARALDATLRDLRRRADEGQAGA